MQTHNPAWDLVSLNPHFVYGPIIHEVRPTVNGDLQLNTTMQDFVDTVFGGAERPADFQFGWVDVRDVSLAHVLALEKELEGEEGKRIMLMAGRCIWQDFCKWMFHVVFISDSMLTRSTLTFQTIL